MSCKMASHTIEDVYNAHSEGDVYQLYLIWIDIRKYKYRNLMYEYVAVKHQYKDIPESREIFRQVIALLKENGHDIPSILAND